MNNAPVKEESLASRPRRGTFLWQTAHTRDRNVWFKCRCGEGRCALELRFNPVVTLCSIVIVSAFVVWCIIDSKNAGDSFSLAKTWITNKFTWLYIGSQDAWAVVIIFIYCSKYGKVKLGRDEDEPEYNHVTWFTMLFACGVGVGLFFYGVAEPVWHYTLKSRYTMDRYAPDNKIAQNAINLTFYHWGIHGWVVYVLVGMLLGIVTFRKGMPMTMKSCFYPLIGDHIYSWPGDAIDILSVITTLFGVCTSLGLGVIQVNAGMNYINENIEKNTKNQVIIIWCITSVATISVVSGLGKGIRRISEVCFTVGMFIMVAVFFLSDPWYLLNLFTQSLGYYIQWIIEVGTHSDAFEMSVPSYGGKDRFREFEDTTSDGPNTWMNSWTIFYWGWWISWSPFVGMFIAKISKGRTIREFVNGSLTAPVLYSFLWMVIFGGTGIRQERLSAKSGLCCANWSPYITSGTEDRLQIGSDLFINPAQVQKADDWNYLCKDLKCSPCAQHLINLAKAGSIKQLTNFTTDLTITETFSSFYRSIQGTRSRFGMISADKGLSRLSCFGTDDMWFAMMYTFGEIGPFLSGFSMFAIVLYFVTSSDSGSLIIDIISANGDQEPPVLQRLFWALVEGATATALLVAGGNASLKALQTASVITGLPYTILLCFMCTSLWRALAIETGDINPLGPDFGIGLLDPFTRLRPKLWLQFIQEIFLTPITVYKVQKKLNDSTTGVCMGILSFVCWLSFVLLLIATYITPVTELAALALVFYFFFVTLVTATRVTVRFAVSINGNAIEDFFAVVLMYPGVSLQLKETLFGVGPSIMMPALIPDEDGLAENHVNENQV